MNLSEAACVFVISCLWIVQKLYVNWFNAEREFIKSFLWIYQKPHVDLVLAKKNLVRNSEFVKDSFGLVITSKPTT